MPDKSKDRLRFFRHKTHAAHWRTPDPEGNGPSLAVRADGAAHALDRYACETDRENDDEETIVTDLLADLQHWCVGNGIDFEQVLARSRAHAEYEADPARFVVSVSDRKGKKR